MIQNEAHRTRRRQPAVQSIFAEPAVASKRGRSPLLRGPGRPGPEFKDVAALLAFAGQFVAEFKTTASVMPSSPHLAQAMIQPAFDRNASVMVEFGPGTGSITEAILDRLPDHGRLFSFEINPIFVDYLQDHFPDPRLHVIPEGAEQAVRALEDHGSPRVDAVVSALPLSFFRPDMRDEIIATAARLLRPGGIFTQFQYVSGLDCSGKIPKPYDLRPLLGKQFDTIERRLTWLNFPPAFVYTCVAG